jgi:glyoxylase-like metal-dependent hydrolase (beta-lactamase superfamily II)
MPCPLSTARIPRAARCSSRPASRRAARGFAVLNVPTIERVAPPGRAIAFGGELVHVLSTPGHTDHCLSFRWRDRLFGGGLLAVGACPFQPCPALPEALWDSVHEQVFDTRPRRAWPLKSSVSGGSVSTVFEERRWHPWLGAGRDDFLARVAAMA